MTYVPRQWRVAFPIVFVILIVLAAVLVLALQHGTLWPAAAAGGAIAGLLLATSWALRHFAPSLSWLFVGAASVPAAFVWLMSPGAGLGGIAVAAAVFSLWVLIYDLGVTARANAEVVSEIVSLGAEGGTPRALIVYHSTHGGFQRSIQRAFAEGLQSQGWRVDLTTASRMAPTNLSAYELLVVGAPSYNWEPARPVLAYLARLGTLKGCRVVLVVSGGGMTDRALRILRARVEHAGGRVLDGIELWTTRANAERLGARDPREIMRRRGAQLGSEWERLLRA